MATLSQRSFSGGEITPSLYARTDISKYITSLRTCRNFYVLRHGGARSRPGTQFIAEAVDSDFKSRLIPFSANASTSYLLEFNDETLRVYKNGALVDEIVTGIADAGTSTFKFAQSVDVMTLALGGTVAELSTTGDTSWAITAIESDRDLSSPGTAFYDITSLSGFSISPSYGGIPTISYALTGVNRLTGRETLLHTKTSLGNNNPTPSGGSPNVIQWTHNQSMAYYKVYVSYFPGGSGAGKFALLKEVVPGVGVTNVTYTDTGADVADYSHLPPPHRTDDFYLPPTEVEWNVPAGAAIPTDDFFFALAVTYFQQRLVLGGNETVKASAINNYKYFETPGNRTITDASPISFTLSGTKLNNIKHLFDLNGLVIFTEGAEMVADGDASGTLTPTGINLRTQSYNGSNDRIPIIIDNIALYVQRGGSVVRDFFYSDSSRGYTGNDLTIFSTHLFENHEIVDWAFQKNPHSIVWAVRDDGVLLSLTYLREQEVLAWARHDFDGGFVERVCAVPEGVEDALYLVIKRTINDTTKRYIEKMSSPFIDDIKDVTSLDSFLTYDGRHTGSTTQTLSGGTDWTYEETLTLTASASAFSGGDVGKEVHLTGSDGTLIRFSIEAYTSETVVTGKANKTVPASMRSVAISTWALAVRSVSGLDHLEGEDVSVFADGYVVANPKNDAYDVVTVSSGAVTLDEHYSVIHVGLPFICDIETLDVDTSQGETGRDKKHKVTQVNMFVEDTRGLWVGAKPPSDDDADPLEDLYEVKVRNTETMDQPVSLKTEVIDVKIKQEWNSNGRVFIRQIDPLPATILSIMPEGNFTLR